MPFGAGLVDEVEVRHQPLLLELQHLRGKRALVVGRKHRLGQQQRKATHAAPHQLEAGERRRRPRPERESLDAAFDGEVRSQQAVLGQYQQVAFGRGVDGLGVEDEARAQLRLVAEEELIAPDTEHAQVVTGGERALLPGEGRHHQRVGNPPSIAGVEAAEAVAELDQQRVARDHEVVALVGVHVEGEHLEHRGQPRAQRQGARLAPGAVDEAPNVQLGPSGNAYEQLVPVGQLAGEGQGPRAQRGEVERDRRLVGAQLAMLRVEAPGLDEQRHVLVGLQEDLVVAIAVEVADADQAGAGRQERGLRRARGLARETERAGARVVVEVPEPRRSDERRVEVTDRHPAGVVEAAGKERHRGGVGSRVGTQAWCLRPSPSVRKMMMWAGGQSSPALGLSTWL